MSRASSYSSTSSCNSSDVSPSSSSPSLDSQSSSPLPGEPAGPQHQWSSAHAKTQPQAARLTTCLQMFHLRVTSCQCCVIIRHLPIHWCCHYSRISKRFPACMIHRIGPLKKQLTGTAAHHKISLQMCEQERKLAGFYLETGQTIVIQLKTNISLFSLCFSPKSVSLQPRKRKPLGLRLKLGLASSLSREGPPSAGLQLSTPPAPR